MFEIQEEIARAIVDQLEIKALDRDQAPQVRRSTENMEVYNLYLEALHHFRAETSSGMEKSIALLERAIDLEPDFAPGHAHLPPCYSTLGGHGYTPIGEVLPKAEEEASKALALDDSLAEAHLAAGTNRAYQYWDWQGAEKHYKRSLELNPGSAEGHHAHCSMVLGPLGRLEEGERTARLAADLDPLSPMRGRVLGQFLFWRHKYEDAIAQIRHTLELDPDFPLTRGLLAAVLTASGQPDEATRQRQIALQRAGREEQADEVGRLYREGGEEALLRHQIEQGLERYKAGKGRAYNLALLYARLDEKDEAFRWLTESLASRVDFIIYAKVHPWLDNLRSDPRFEAVLDELGVNQIRR